MIETAEALLQAMQYNRMAQSSMATALEQSLHEVKMAYENKMEEIDTISQIVANTEESELKTVLNRYLEVIDNG